MVFLLKFLVWQILMHHILFILCFENYVMIFIINNLKQSYIDIMKRIKHVESNSKERKLLHILKLIYTIYI